MSEATIIQRHEGNLVALEQTTQKLEAAAEAYVGKPQEWDGLFTDPVKEDGTGGYEQRIKGKEQAVDDFLANAHPEKRHVQKITIGGSSDFLYPVMWGFPSNTFGVGKLEISRAYHWNRGTLHATHVAALLLQLEGNSVPWGGDANYMKIRKFHQRYNATASHLQFAGYANRESADGVNQPDYGGDGVNYIYSGVYLRGGGLDYVLSSNWAFTPVRIDEDDPNAERVLHAYKNSKFVVRPIPLSELRIPVEN